ncbi:M14 family metallopeptidase [Amycolatopsis sp. H20-H5]|uniref:M14 family metallopeptidase n=1 Tax=Amycolatopsis sp. H20-H5 TaxID=3046309 RepID=UPI002DBE99C0|nr:M14 family metallopeptidase [Amycolatopsis sp. H20-H5]MEC3979560.1 M14 family metallopeptidase [Amycolatopsis sp. H20-H5]
MALALSALVVFATGVAGGPALAVTPPSVTAGSQFYEVGGTSTPQLRTVVARTGVDVLGASGDTMSIIARPADAEGLRALGFTVSARGPVDRPLGPAAIAADFPAGDEGYHTYAETTTELQKAVSNFPSLAKLTSVGKSYEGRNLNLLKISDNVATDENEPEVLFTCNQHAREHLTTEMCLRIVQRFTSSYATDPAIKKLVDSTEIYVLPNVNPDGSEYDISGGRYHSWRKNRQGPGTDTNRNWGYKWGCCGGSSGSTGSETYRGPSAFSAPETKAVSDYVDSRRIGGVQQIKAHIDFHTYSELVLWPFGYTYNDTAPGMTAAEAKTFSDLGKKMAATNGYTPEQSSDLYITDGAVNDWMWGNHKILSFTFEMYPKGGNPGFYPPDEQIVPQTTRNDKAVDILLNAAFTR